ncbi:hypothetical protein ELG72_24940 [Rhizobium leguminosarum]|uniref:hypothetical protein n=1 Tax=Rhizobium leguminosarum TaxID=384 RepID=UPI0010306D7F|nr:hypothetical protein [Rhizobium leguminosarum]TBG66107.1 hypothetical protein ELG72_24940 [Rhizobium leguminosarum]TBG70865.1 hypothetical protein ELG74_24690 [Rhizobium leguminosarum]
MPVWAMMWAERLLPRQNMSSLGIVAKRSRDRHRAKVFLDGNRHYFCITGTHTESIPVKFAVSHQFSLAFVRIAFIPFADA